MDKEKERERRLTREQLTKKLSKVTTSQNFCLYLNLVNIFSTKITKALEIVDRDIAFDSFCL